MPTFAFAHMAEFEGFAASQAGIRYSNLYIATRMATAPKLSTAAFRELVDEALGRLPLVEVDDVLKRYNSEFADGQPVDRVDRLYAVIKRSLCLESTGDGPMAALRRLRRSCSKG